jgi:hypothetical protein
MFFRRFAIANENLTEAAVPPFTGGWDHPLTRFALSFDGYEYTKDQRRSPPRAGTPGGPSPRRSRLVSVTPHANPSSRAGGQAPLPATRARGENEPGTGSPTRLPCPPNGAVSPVESRTAGTMGRPPEGGVVEWVGGSPPPWGWPGK